jgi:hypothetical protein
MRFEVRAVDGVRTPVLLAGPIEVERLRARAIELEALLAEAAEIARRGLPVGLTEDEAFALAILAGEPALVRQLLRLSPRAADPFGGGSDVGHTGPLG